MARRKRGPWAFIGAVAGISLITPYVLNQGAKLWPNSPLATLNNGIHKGTGS
jgi:hypothetical protein